MNNLTASSFSRSTITINEERKPNHLVLTLRKASEKEANDIKEKAKKITSMREELDSSINLNQSSLNQSTLNNSTIDVFNQSMYSLNNSINISSLTPAVISSADSPTENDFQIAAKIQEVDLLVQDNDIHTNQQAATEAHLEELEPLQDEISTFDIMATHLRNFVDMHGTTIATATTTVGLGVATVATGGLINVLGGGIAVAVSANEFWKMCKAYLNEHGASDHLQALQTALANIENKRKISKDLIEKAQKLNNSVQVGINKIDVKIEFLKTQLSHVSGELAGSIKEALQNAVKTKESLIAQKEKIEKALQSSEQAKSVIDQQHKKLEALIETFNTQKVDNHNFQEVLDEIKSKIVEIMADSTKAFDHQTEANNFMLGALNLVSEVIALEDQQVKLILAIQILEQELKNAQSITNEMKIEIGEIKVNNEKISENLTEQKKINKEQRTEIEIAQDALQAEKSVETFGNTSVLIGSNGAIVTMMGAGFISFGPPGAIVGALAAGIFVINPAVSVAHYTRKLFKVNHNIQLDAAFQSCANNLAEGKFDAKKGVELKAQFSYNNAPVFGAGAYKGLWNMSASAVNYWSPNAMSYWQSKREGKIDCQIGGIQIPQLGFYAHKDYNKTFDKYGAISLIEQQRLAAVLLEGLEQNQIEPQIILDFLTKMTKVQVVADDGSVLNAPMIKRDSKAMRSLKLKCAQKILEIKNQKCAHNEMLDLNKK